MNRLALAFVAALLALTTAAHAQYVGGYDQSSSLDASQISASVEKVEAAPLTTASKNGRSSLLQQFTTTPGMGFVSCTGLFANTSSPEARRNSAILSTQLALGAYAFQFQHLGSEPDDAMILQAGIESLLRAYRNMPGYSDPALDTLAKERDAHTLLAHIRSGLLTQCKVKPNHFNG